MLKLVRKTAILHYINTTIKLQNCFNIQKKCINILNWQNLLKKLSISTIYFRILSFYYFFLKYVSTPTIVLLPIISGFLIITFADTTFFNSRHLLAISSDTVSAKYL